MLPFFHTGCRKAHISFHLISTFFPWHRSVCFTSVPSCNQEPSFTAAPHMCRPNTNTHVHTHTHRCILNLTAVMDGPVFITHRREKIREAKERKTNIKWEMKAWQGGQSTERKGKTGGRERERESALQRLNNCFLWLFSFLWGIRETQKAGSTESFLSDSHLFECLK